MSTTITTKYHDNGSINMRYQIDDLTVLSYFYDHSHDHEEMTVIFKGHVCEPIIASRELFIQTCMNSHARFAMTQYIMSRDMDLSSMIADLDC